MAARFRFDRFVLDLESGTLFDADAPVHLQPKAFELLALLVRHPGVLFSREELLERLWPDVHVTDESLSQVVARVRRALDGTGFLETVPRRGYRFVAEVTEEASPVAAPVRVPGRDREAEAVRAGLAAGRPVLLHGPPGAGKTFLARAIPWPGERVEVALAGVRSAGEVVAAVARSLGVAGEAGASALAARVGLTVAARTGLLVVLDALESTEPDARELVGRWIHAGGRWLVTSRERTGFDGEVVVPVGPLEDAAAVDLLASRLPAGTRPADGRLLPLVRALDGLPLALELAAVRLRILAPEEVLALLGRRFQVLREPGGRSLAAAIAGAWDLLEDDDREALSRLAVAAVPLELPAAASLLEPRFAPDVIQRLDDRAWLVVEPGPRGTRFAVRRHLREWVLEHADRATLRHATDALAAWLAREAFPRAEVARKVADPEAWGWLREHADAVLAVLGDPDLDVASRWPLVRVAGLALQMWGTADEIEALAARTLAEGSAVPAEVRIRVLWWLGQARRLADRGAHEAEAREALALAEALGDLSLRSGGESGVAHALLVAGRREEALASANRALALAEDARDPFAASHALAEIRFAGRGGREGVEALEAILDLPLPAASWTRLRALANFATDLHDAGRYDEAEARYRDRLEAIPEALDPAWQRTVVLGNLGNLLADTLRFEEAEAPLEDAIRLARRAGQLGYVWRYTMVAAERAIDAGDPAAGELLARRVATDERAPAPYRIEAGVVLGLAAWRAGRLPAATVRAEEALARAATVADIAPAWLAATWIAGAAGDVAGAAIRLGRGREEAGAGASRTLRAFVGLAEAFEARARGADEEQRAALRRLEAPGPPEPLWPDGAPPLSLHLRRLQWVVDRL